MKYKYFFTISAGRTGSAWLASFLGENLGIKSIHEPLGIDDFGVRMPDIRLMRMFNMRGNTSDVQKFYRFKLDEISNFPSYAETNHTLAKCGLVENLATHRIASDSLLIILTRDFVAQCRSYIVRGDFMNVTIDWQWYLSERYRNNIIDFAPFERHSIVGRALWYCYEMDARQRYYEHLYSSKIKMVRLTLQEITSPVGARRLLEECGHLCTPILPVAKNQSQKVKRTHLDDQIERLVSGIKYDGEAIVREYIDSNARLSLDGLFQ